MLMVDSIRKNKYFQAIYMKDKSLLDPLTQTIVRKHIVQYAKYLIKNRIPFYMGILDVDNFKYINDTYGHNAGDEVLVGISHNIMNALPDNAYVGRFGGDEFIIIIEKEKSYDNLHDILRDMYRNGVRKAISIGNDQAITVTTTTGFSNYPIDSKTYDEVFEKCDKCLYRGKYKGRNCFIIYVESKHKDIVINKHEKVKALDIINRIHEIFDTEKRNDKLNKAMNYLTNVNSITGMAYINKAKIRASYVKAYDYGEAPIIDKKLIDELVGTNGYYKVNNIEHIRESNPEFYKLCYENNLLSFLIYKVSFMGRDLGYLLVYDSDYRRIWQESDEVVFTVFSKMIGSVIHFLGA